MRPASSPGSDSGVNRTFQFRNSSGGGNTGGTGGVVIESLLPNPAGDDAQLEEVTLKNKGTALVSLAGWTLKDRSNLAWQLSGNIGAGQSKTFRRNGMAMTLNNNGDEIVGYTASNTVTATIKKIGDAGDVVDAAVAAGANQVSGPNLLASDQDAAYRNALKSAVAQARSKAETLAGAANATLGKMTAMVEGGGVVPLPATGARDSVAPIEPGTQRIEASVSVTFALG